MNYGAMSGSGVRRWQKRAWRVGWLAGISAWYGMVASPQAAPPTDGISPAYRPDNIYVYPPRLSPEMRRVALLPVGTEMGGEVPDGCAALTPIVWEQLVKTKRFEVVAVDADALRHGSGRASWTGTETLPPDFFAFLRREYGCDGVLFVELTAYRAYAPLALGFRFKLVDVRSSQILWATDEIFDASRPAVRRGAQRFGEPWLTGVLGRDENWEALNSPRQFGRYCMATLFKTLPER